MKIGVTFVILLALILPVHATEETGSSLDGSGDILDKFVDQETQGAVKNAVQEKAKGLLGNLFGVKAPKPARAAKQETSSYPGNIRFAGKTLYFRIASRVSKKIAGKCVKGGLSDEFGESLKLKKNDKRKFTDARVKVYLEIGADGQLKRISQLSDKQKQAFRTQGCSGVLVGRAELIAMPQETSSDLESEELVSEEPLDDEEPEELEENVPPSSGSLRTKSVRPHVRRVPAVSAAASATIPAQTRIIDPRADDGLVTNSAVTGVGVEAPHVNSRLRDTQFLGRVHSYEGSRFVVVTARGNRPGMQNVGCVRMGAVVDGNNRALSSHEIYDGLKVAGFLIVDLRNPRDFVKTPAETKDTRIQMNANKSGKCPGSVYPGFNEIDGYDINVVRVLETR